MRYMLLLVTFLAVFVQCFTIPWLSASYFPDPAYRFTDTNRTAFVRSPISPPDSNRMTYFSDYDDYEGSRIEGLSPEYLDGETDGGDENINEDYKTDISDDEDDFYHEDDFDDDYLEPVLVAQPMSKRTIAKATTNNKLKSLKQQMKLELGNKLKVAISPDVKPKLDIRKRKKSHLRKETDNEDKKVETNKKRLGSTILEKSRTGGKSKIGKFHKLSSKTREYRIDSHPEFEYSKKLLKSKQRVLNLKAKKDEEEEELVLEKDENDDEESDEKTRKLKKHFFVPEYTGTLPKSVLVKTVSSICKICGVLKDFCGGSKAKNSFKQHRSCDRHDSLRRYCRSIKCSKTEKPKIRRLTSNPITIIRDLPL